MKKGGILIRTATTCVALPVVMAVIWSPYLRPGFSLLVAVFACIGLYEYYAIVRARQISPETIGGILAGTLVTLSGHWGNVRLTSLLLYGGCLLVSALHIVRGQHSVAGLASSVFGVFYVGWFAAHITLLRGVADVGAGLVTLLFIAVFLTDSAAYLAGSAFGRHKLASKVSPNKTWEGAVAGLVCAVAGMAFLYWLRGRFGFRALPDWSLARYIHIGATLSIVGQIGDLAESCLKRDAGVKDSGVFFPGHGGVLDRCDSLLFTGPVLYYFVVPWT